MIAVIMGADDSKTRFKDAVTLLNHGFGICQVYRDDNPPKLEDAAIQNGIKDSVKCKYAGTFTYLDTQGQNLSGIEKSVKMNPEIKAPVKKGDVLGKLVYTLNESELGSVDIISSETVEKATFLDKLKQISSLYFEAKK